MRSSQFQEVEDVARSRRSCKKLIRFTPAELATVNARAQAAGQAVACYIRDASLGARKRAIASPPIGGAVVRKLARLATQLCSLRDSASARELPEAVEFGTGVEDLLNLIRQID